MDNLAELLRSYRAGQLERAAIVERLIATGLDASDAAALVDNQNYTPPGDMAEQFIAREQRRRNEQVNPLRRQ